MLLGCWVVGGVGLALAPAALAALAPAPAPAPAPGAGRQRRRRRRRWPTPIRGENRSHFVVAEAANLAEVVANSVGEKLLQLLVAFEQRLERNAQPRFHRDFDYALRRPPQRKRIFRSGGNQPHPEAAAQRVELIRDRYNLPGKTARNRVFHAHRLVVLVNRNRDFFRFALCPGIKSADYALQLGELL